MNTASSFSISNTSIPQGTSMGFMSASSRMQQMESEATAAEEAASAQRAERNLLRTVATERSKDDDDSGSYLSNFKRKADMLVEPVNKRHNARTPPPGQGSITSFFGRPTAIKPTRTEDQQVAEAIAFVKEKKMRTAAGAIDKTGTWLNGVAERTSQGQSSSRFVQDKENLHIAQPKKNTFVRPSFTSSRSFSTAASIHAPLTTPQAPPSLGLASHKVRTDPLRPRPLRRHDDTTAQNVNGRPYPFYSSSPPRPQGKKEEEEDTQAEGIAEELPNDPDPDEEAAATEAEAEAEAEARQLDMADVADLEDVDADVDDAAALAPAPPPSSPPLLLPSPAESTTQQQQQQPQPLLSFHTTSVDRLQQPQGLRRPGRTLGLRRDVGSASGGWVNRPFVKPTVQPRTGPPGR
ncbi:hypothetical protein HDK64DRAFT_266535 [Phyllosticta capitalensis]